MFFYRYAIYSACAFPLLVGVAFASIKNQRLQFALASSFFILLAYQNLAVSRPLRADYKSMAIDIHKDGTPPVLVLKTLNHEAIWYALERNAEDVELFYGIKEVRQATLDYVAAGECFWISFYHWDTLEAFDLFLTESGIPFEKRSYAGIPPLYGYRIGCTE